MSYEHHVEQFYGLPAYTFSPYTDPVDLPDPGSVAWRFQCEEMSYEDDFLSRAEEIWTRFTESAVLGRHPPGDVLRSASLTGRRPADVASRLTALGYRLPDDVEYPEVRGSPGTG
ncbi:hypothetical protein NKH18_18505 [Streptomyces sp. M10(2022)]